MLLLEAWARDGLTDEQISNKMGISARTFYEYRNKYPQIMQSLKRGKEVIDFEVENALLKKAKGFYVPIKKHFKVKKVLVENGTRKEIEELVEVEEQLYVPPDTTAQIFWLKNRKTEQWRDKKEYVPEPTERMESKLTLEELRTIAEHLAKGE